MISLDTDVLVRFLVRDDEEQYERARRLIRPCLESWAIVRAIPDSNRSEARAHLNLERIVER